MTPRELPARATSGTPEARRASAEPAGAFTLIELMVVIAIIIVMAGIMSPSVAEFLKNRKIEFIRSELVSSFHRARLKAVNEGSRVSVVFFREGVRVFDERRKEFVDEFFEPGNSPLAKGEAWFVLGFLGDKESTSLPSYYDWERTWRNLVPESSSSQPRKSRDRGPSPVLTGLPKILFERDGSLRFETGADVSTNFFNEPVPSKADIVIYQTGGTTACFVDLRLAGQIRTKIVPIEGVSTGPKTPIDEGPAGARKRGKARER
ncbi:MAG: pilus assembly FimT family protein [Planctomycetota bacterium]